MRLPGADQKAGYRGKASASVAELPVQSVARPLRHLVAYGSTNKYRPVKNCRASGITAKRPTEAVYFFWAMATMLTMTATVKAMDSQRWVCRTHLFQFNGTSSEVSPTRIVHTYKYLLFDHKKVRVPHFSPILGEVGIETVCG